MQNMIKLCSLMISAAVLFAGCSQSVSSSQVSTSSEPMSSSSASSAASSASSASSSEASSSQSSSEPIVSQSSSSGGIDPEFTVSEAIRPSPWWEEFLSSSPGEYKTEYKLYDNGRRISVSANHSLFSKSTHTDLQLLSDSAVKVLETDLGDTLDDISFFEILMPDDTKYTGYLFEEGIALTRSLPGQDAGEPVYLSIDEEDYQELLIRMEDAFDSFVTTPSWLALMRLSKCDTIVGYYANGEALILDSESGERGNIFRKLQGIPVQANSVKFVATDTELPGSQTVLINFINGIQYRIQINQTSLLIASSDMSTALNYNLAVDGNGWIKSLSADNWNYYENPMTG